MNQNSAITKRTLVATSIILTLIIIFCGLMSLIVLSDPAIKYSQVLTNAATAMRSSYSEELNWSDIFRSAIQAMINELDPFSGYVDHEQLTQFEEELSGGYYGIGISVIPHDSGLLILDVREGSPAAVAGLLTGDIIVKADTISLAGMNVVEAVRLIKGEENTVFNAAIYRPATEDTFQFEIVRNRIDFLHIPFAGFTPDSAVYVRLLDFNAGAADDFKNALDTLTANDTKKIKGIIIDLRGNPGGLFLEAEKLAEIFLNEGEFIVGTSGRSRWNEETSVSKKNGDYSRFPLAVIVDNGSASAAEIVAGALKYSGRAVLVGDTTFGKGLVQGFVRLPDGDGLRLTISRYYFEGHRFINPLDSAAKVHGIGLPPDIYYSFIEESPFYLQLERELILLRFAHKYQEEIILSSNTEVELDKWINELKKFAYENEFSYKSELTKTTEWLVIDSDTPKIKRLAERALETAKSMDENLFQKHADFLWMRLRQIAYERKFGTYRAYKDVIVSEYGPIKTAAGALFKKDSL